MSSLFGARAAARPPCSSRLPPAPHDPAAAPAPRLTTPTSRARGARRTAIDMAAADKPNGISYAEAILGDLKDRMPTAEEFGTEKHVRAHLRPNRFFRLGSETAPLCQLNVRAARACARARAPGAARRALPAAGSRRPCAPPAPARPARAARAPQWVVSLIASVFLWTFVIACAVVPADARLAFGFGQSFITQNFTWLYIGTNDAWAIFFIWLCFSRFGSMKLGLNDQEKPEFSDSAWFAMLFTCGVAIGMFTFGVSEPMFYYRVRARALVRRAPRAAHAAASPRRRAARARPAHSRLARPLAASARAAQAGYSNRLNKLPIDNDDQRAQQALTLTLFHWGIHGYIPYVVATLAMGLPAYRWGLPLTVRTAFYPLAGDLTKGLLGDIVDAISIACTTFGVCTSLGLGAETIAAGIAKLRKDPALASSIELQAGLVWIITVIATGSVVLGLKRGIKNLSYFAFGIGSFLIVVTMMFGARARARGAAAAARALLRRRCCAAEARSQRLTHRDRPLPPPPARARRQPVVPAQLVRPVRRPLLPVDPAARLQLRHVGAARV